VLQRPIESALGPPVKPGEDKLRMRTTLFAAPTPTLPRKRGEVTKSNQLAATAGTWRWRFMTILLSAPR
jgi:hypothetical protein